MSKYNELHINVYECGDCGVIITENKYYTTMICKKCSVINALDDALENIATDDNESTLNIKLADFLLTTDKRGLDEILADNLDDDLTELWEILNKFNPSGNFLTDEMDNDLAFTTDEWDGICTEMAWIKEDLN